MERDFPETVAEELRKMGYDIHLRSAIGRTDLILVMPDGKFEAVADRRGDDGAAGY
jgi:gamma-glutamyltranspeptidase/glutathione hydrolase